MINVAVQLIGVNINAAPVNIKDQAGALVSTVIPGTDYNVIVFSGIQDDGTSNNSIVALP